MSALTVLLVQFALVRPAMSQTCRVTPDSIKDSAATFEVMVDNPVADIAVFAQSELPPHTQIEANKVLRLDTFAEDFRRQMQNVLMKNGRYIFSLRNQFTTLAKTIVTKNIDHVAIDVEPENILAAERDAWKLLTEGFKYAPDDKEDVENLMFLAFGPILTLRVRHPNLFIGVRLEGLPYVSARAPTLIEEKPKPPPKKERRADEQYKETLEKLGSSAQTRATFINMAANLKKNPHPYPKLNPSQTKERLLKRFWAPAKKPVGDWIDAFYLDIKDTGAAPPSLPTPEPKPSSSDVGMTAFLLKQTGNWAVYLPVDTYDIIEEQFRQVCAVALVK